MNEQGLGEMTKLRTALITGASSGIGKAFAWLLAEQGYQLVLIARRENYLQVLKENIIAKHRIEVFIHCEDLSQGAAPENIYTFCQENNLTIDILVNNAGYGLNESFHNLNWQKHQDFIQVLFTAVIHLIHLFLPMMMKRKFGRIINVASISGLIQGTGMYSTTKAALIKFSEGVHQDYKTHGVYCCAVCPGLTHTEFHDEMPYFKKVIPSIMWMSPKTVALQAWKASMNGKFILINGLKNKVFVFFVKLLPRGSMQLLFHRLRR